MQIPPWAVNNYSAGDNIPCFHGTSKFEVQGSRNSNNEAYSERSYSGSYVRKLFAYDYYYYYYYSKIFPPKFWSHKTANYSSTTPLPPQSV